jgi:hypothetical protein
MAGYGILCMPSVNHHLGLLATPLEDWSNAEAHFTAAIRRATDMDAKPFLAHTQLALARMLTRRNKPSDRSKAHQLLSAAITAAEELSMRTLA